jgi:hypothetical protein
MDSLFHFILFACHCPFCPSPSVSLYHLTIWTGWHLLFSQFPNTQFISYYKITMSTSKQTSASTKYFALRAVSCCAIFTGVFCNLPSNRQISDGVSLKGKNDGVSFKDEKSDTVAFHLPASEAHTVASVTHENENAKLDFFVAGFPKCGTTTLLKAFEAHNETSVHPQEECSLAQVFSDDEAYNRLIKNLNRASSDPYVKRGIKCPFGLSTPTAIERLEIWFPGTKLIFGLRHPVFYFQSFYNYRVSMAHQNKLEGPIPPPESLIGSNDWARVSTDTARFEQVLKTLGKTISDESPPTPFKVFLYTLEQMEDEDEDRGQQLLETLGSFLELRHQIQPLQAANKNEFVGKKGFDETIDICDDKHNHLRSVLVENGRESQRWIREEFLESPDVTVANAEHFNEIVEQWGLDPCVKENM